MFDSDEESVGEQWATILSHAIAVARADGTRVDAAEEQMLERAIHRFAGDQLSSEEIKRAARRANELYKQRGALVLDGAGQALGNDSDLCELSLKIASAVATASSGINAAEGGHLHKLANALGIKAMSPRYMAILAEGMTLGRS